MRFNTGFNTIALGLALAGCSAGVSSVAYDPASTGPLSTSGMPYSLPKGVVPVQVFVEAAGIGISIEPAQTVVDSRAGILVARLKPSPFNIEHMKLTADAETGFLSAVSSESEAQLLAIAEELAKTAGRLALQNSKATFLETRVVVFQDSFDPLSTKDRDRINEGIRVALGRAAQAFRSSGGLLTGSPPDVKLDVDMGDGADIGTTATEEAPPSLKNCGLGVCVRAMTSRRIVVSLGGQPFASKMVNVPARSVIAVPIPQTVLANQKVSITIKDGILANYNLDRDFEVLGLVKIPGAIIGGVISGMTQGLTDATNLSDKQTALVDSTTKNVEAQKNLKDATIKLNSSTASEQKGLYAASTLTVYPYSDTLAQAIRAKRTQANTVKPPVSGRGDNDLTSDPPKVKPGQ